MSKRQYIRAINEEIEKLNGIIDFKILHDSDYRKEARRHKRLLAQIRRTEARRAFGRLTKRLVPGW